MNAKHLLGQRSYRLVAALVIIGVLFFAYELFGQMFKGQELSNEVAAQAAENERLQKEHDELQAKLDWYQAGGYDKYAEKRAREDLNLSKPGDIVLMPMPLSSTLEITSTAQPNPESTAEAGDGSFLDKLVDLFRP